MLINICTVFVLISYFRRLLVTPLSMMNYRYIFILLVESWVATIILIKLDGYLMYETISILPIIYTAFYIMFTERLKYVNLIILIVLLFL